MRTVDHRPANGSSLAELQGPPPGRRSGTLQSLGLEVVQEAAVTPPPLELRRRLPRRYRYTLPLAHRIAGDLATVTLFRAASR